ncbi:MAG TPA: LicD family protein [Bacteroidaceae bacterium]|nr:LicD family protein [Bacteroidaceae bacterium]
MLKEDFSLYNGPGTTLRVAQLRMVEILREVDRVCRKNAIPYWLDFGTLLGAIRHKGFIPWDDDVDVAILSKDYKKLIKCLNRDLDKKYFVESRSTDRRHSQGFFKVVDKNTDVRYIQGESNRKYQGINVDIFPMERGNNRVKNMVDFCLGRIYRRLGHNVGGKVDYFLACLLWLPCKIIIALVRFYFSLRKGDMLVYSFGVEIYCTKWLNHSLGDIFPLKEIEFEGHSFFAPNNTDSYLTRAYNDYMEIPPVEKRSKHYVEINIFD